MNILRRLREEAKKFDCSVCGTNHTRSDIRVLGKLDTSKLDTGKLDTAWIVRVTCSTCQTAFKLLVVVEENTAAVTPVKEERPRASKRPPVTSDDVIDAHEALREFEGDAAALFKRTPVAARRDARRT